VETAYRFSQLLMGRRRDDYLYGRRDLTGPVVR